MNNVTRIGNITAITPASSENVNDAMAELGATTIAGLLGTYQANLDERDELLAEALHLANDGESQTPRSLDVWTQLERAQRRLWLFAVLANEAYGR